MLQGNKAPCRSAVLIARDIGFDPDRHDPDMYDRLAKALGAADRVVVACDTARRVSWASALKGANVQCELYSPELAQLSSLGIARQGGGTLIVSTGPLGLADRMIKRTFDMGIGLVALPFFRRH